MRALRILVSVITLFSIHTCFAQQSKNDWEKENLKGRVKTLAEMRTYDMDSVREKSWLNMPILHIFNTAGNIVLSKRYTLFENSIDSTVYFYDCKNRLSLTLTFNSKGILRDSINYIYFEDGSKTEYYNFGINSAYVISSIKKYDFKGNLIHEVSKHSSKYNGSNRVVERIETITNSYNKKNWLVKSTISRSDVKPYSVEIYKYDKRGNKIEQKVLVEEKILSINRYNSTRNPIEYIYFDNEANIEYQTKMTYNEWGDQIGQTGSNRNGKPILPYKIEYEYDSQHNWTKETLYYGNEIKSIRVRTIEYF